MNDAVTTRTRQDGIANLLHIAESCPEDITNATRGKLSHRSFADHPAVGHDADVLDAEPLSQAIHDRDQCLDIGRVARQQIATDRPPFIVEHYGHDHLRKVRAMVFAVAALSE